ncbi:MAG TPA: hypothetical protein EYH05_10610 [Anaerolineae bacterium]|nr:hypothetical protein [Anaerolineae bacterium]
MSSQRQLPTETANSLKHIFDVLVNALQSTTAGSAKLLLYLIATITILNIIGHDKINSLVIPPAILYVIKGLAASPVIQKIVDQLGGDLLANMIEHFANRDSLREDKILEFIENQINTKELNQLIDNVVQDSALLKEQDFYRVVARQQREDKKQTAMLELLVQHAIAGSITENTPYQLPSRMLTENFVNREDELKQITSHLQPGKTIIVTGSGGIGKSALAAEALWQIHEDFELRKRFPDGVVIYDWSLQPNVSIASSIIAHAFGYPSVNDPNVIKSIMNSKKCLLIFDNAEEATELEFLLSGSHSCGIIITSRRNLPIDGIHIELQRLSDAQGEELLRKLLNIEAVTTPIFIQELIQELEGLPLALALASKHIDRKSNDATSYLQWLRNSLKALEIADGRKHSLPLVIQQNIRSVSKVARLVLLVMGNHAFRPLTDVTFAIAFHPNFQFSQGEIQNALSELIDQNLVQVHKVDFDDGNILQCMNPNTD